MARDQTQAKAWTVAGVQGGWGNGAFPNACGVLVPGSTDSVGFNGSGALCSANVQRVQEFTVGFWQDIYKGDLGRARVGLEYEYVQLSLFSGATGAIPGASGVTTAAATAAANTGLHPNNNIVFLAPLLSLQLSGTGRKLCKASSASAGGALCLPCDLVRCDTPLRSDIENLADSLPYRTGFPEGPKRTPVSLVKYLRIWPLNGQYCHRSSRYRTKPSAAKQSRMATDQRRGFGGTVVQHVPQQRPKRGQRRQLGLAVRRTWRTLSSVEHFRYPEREG